MQQGKEGGVIGLIHVYAFVVPGDMSFVAYIGGMNAPYIQENKGSTQ